MIRLDDHGQPLNRLYNHKRLNDRTIDEFIGLCRGLIADKNINEAEAQFLHSWMETNISYCEDQLVNVLYLRIREMLADDIFDEAEQKELLGILQEFTGEKIISHPQTLTTTLPFDSSLPTIEFSERIFCLTGRFAYGPRRLCEGVIKDLGGIVAGNVSQKVHYLVVGTFCSTDWLHTSYGLKIENAAKLRGNGFPISIVPEDAWAQAAFPA